MITRLGGFIYKIPDDRRGVSIRKPFDGFGMIARKPLYWEAKVLGAPIKPHQLQELWRIAMTIDSICGFVFGYKLNNRIELIWASIDGEVYDAECYFREVCYEGRDRTSCP